MRIAVLFFSILWSLQLRADEFYVTNNANAGVGTLRAAIIGADANGTATTDYIYFNIPALAVDDVTIILTTALPNLSSNLVVDATTQPTVLLGNQSIKIRLVKGSVDFFSGFNLDGITNVSIYGFYFANFLSERGVPSDDRKAGIYLNNTSHIIIGAPGKQNGFGGNYTSVISPTSMNTQEDITISSNIIGLNAQGTASNSNEIGIDLSYLSNSMIGGPTAEYGNLISSNENGGLSLGAMKNNVVVQHNIIGFDITKTTFFYTAGSVGIFANGEFVNLSILDNDVVSQDIGIRVDNVKTKFLVEGNHIGIGEQKFGNRKYGIELYNCNEGLINKNIIAYNTIGVYMDLSYPISILKNSFYCNPKAMEVVKYPAGKFTTLSRISTITTTGASGKYLPNATVELFYTDSCPDCQGKTWVATVVTDANGDWSYLGPINGKLTSLGTNVDGATGLSFSKPFIDNASAVITGVNCGESTGTISITVYDASIFRWYNSITNQLVSEERKLTGQPNGSYYLKAGNDGACDVVSSIFRIDAGANGINDLQMKKNQTYCGSATGYIRDITVANDVPRIWYNAAGEEVSRDNNLENRQPGNYYFVIGEGACKVSSPIYTIENIVVTYSVNSAQVSIRDATCGETNGSITISGFVGVRPDNFKWYDSKGIEVSTLQNLINMPPDKYRLVGFGDNSCSNTIGEFTVRESPLPTINYSVLEKFISCDGKTVSTKGIAVNGTTAPYSYSWVDENDVEVSNRLNLVNSLLGRYQLRVKDKNGCVVNGIFLDFSVLKETILQIPNSFTPNNDGINDFWQIAGSVNYPFADFNVYSRNGTKVFSSRGYKTPFDGKLNGVSLPNGVYYYVIDPKTSCDIISGSLTIIR